ncbi:MAG: PQQ-binding-like beta-propeller repeat protein [Tepidisphaeraceae bacterium]|jgi:outer membrane protein assembly factor BamB
MNRRLMHPLGSGLVVLLISLSGCQTDHATTAAGSGVTAAPVRVDQDNFHALWYAGLPVDKGDFINRVWVQQNLVLVCTPNNVVYSIDKTNGILQSINYVKGGGREIGTPVVLPRHIVFVGQSNLEIYKRVGGAFERSIQLPFTISSNAVGTQDQVFFGANLQGGELIDVSLTATYVPVNWRLVMHGAVRGAPGFHTGTLYVGSGDGGLYAVNVDRTPLWSLDHDRFDTGAEIIGDVKADDTGVYAASNGGRLVCVSRTTGILQWQYLCPNRLPNGPDVTRTTVYELIPGMGLAAISKDDPMAIDDLGRRKVQAVNRTPRWICPEAAQFVAEDRLLTYVLTTDQQLWGLDRLTGQVRYRGNGAHFAAAAVNPADDTIYAVTTDGTAYALKSDLHPGSAGYLE